MRSFSIGIVLIGCASLILQSVAFAAGSFEVHGVATDSTIYIRGKIEKQPPGDEVTYLVDPEKGVITRTAVFNKNIRTGLLSGLQADGTVYKIVYMDHAEPFFTNRLIKGIGQTGGDGFETLVIGEDFVTTARSTSDYFAIYYYKRSDLSSRTEAR